MRRAAARPQDLVARYGGEEFVLLLPHQDVAGAEFVARKLLDEVAQLAIPHAKSTAGPLVTVSMGLASTTPNEKVDPANLVKMADALLYRSKAEGRNRYSL
jgi:diguanylate cyclase (GGDEF)-like protein